MNIVFYNDAIPDFVSWIRGVQFAGITTLFFIFIRKKYRGDRGLLEHEKVHAKQFWKYLLLYPIFYMASWRFRLRMEVEAYKKQLEFYGDDRARRFAEFIATKYRIPISVDEAERLLRR